MPPKLSTDSFLSAVRQSGLIEDSQLRKFWQNIEQSGRAPQDSDRVADELVGANLLSRWQTEQLLQGKHKGFFLGKYRLISLLGSGGMSAVYLAEHTLMRRRVAIKVLPKSRIDDTSYLERFHREAQAVASLDHPNIMRAYDVDQEGKNHFLVMEYIEGKSFLELVTENGPVSFVNSAEYIRQSAEGLSHAHEAGMIHRDIKPGNILVDKRGVVKILDMGLAMFFDPTGKDDEESSLTIQHDERVLGTADYLSPEQALNSHAVDVRTDIYSLGCTFYFILTGHPPFPEGSLAQRLLFHQTKQPAALEIDRPDIPTSLSDIVKKMMSKRPSDRYQTAREVQEVLAKWLLANGDAEWRDKNSILIAAATGGSGIHNRVALPPVAMVVSPVARPVTSQPAIAPPQPVPNATKPVPAPPAVTTTRPSTAPQTPAAKAATPAQPKSAVQPKPPAPVTVPNESPFVFSPPASGPKAVAKAGQAESAQGDFDGFDPSEFATFQEPSATIKGSSSSTIKHGRRSAAAGDPLSQMLKNKTARLAIAATVLTIFLLLTTTYYMRLTPAKKPTSTKSREKIEEYVVGTSGKFKSISSALEELKAAGFAKSTIRVVGKKTYSERLNLSDLPANVTIFAEESGGPTLSSEGPEPLLDIADVRGLKIEGFNLDATGKEVAVRFKGKLPQSELLDCTITGFTKRGVLLEGARGSTTDRVLLDRVRLKSAGPNAVGIALTKGALTPAFVSIDSCRIFGPMAAAISIESSCEDFKIVKNVMTDVGIGLRFSGEKRSLKYLGIANNTFFKLQQGIAFASMPSASSEKLSFSNNLFAQIEGAEFAVEKGYVDSDFAGFLDAQTGNNWTDKPMLDPKMVIFGNAGQAAVNFQFQSIDAENPAFLAPSPTSPQREAPAGPWAEAYIGAIPSQ